MTWWALSRRGPILLPAISLYLATWWVVRNDIFGSRHSFTMMVGLAFATLIAAALEAREDGLELGTVRPIGVFDAGLVLVLSALAAVGLAIIGPYVLGGAADMIWATWFGAGLVAFGSALKRTAVTIGVVTLTYAALWAMRFVVGPSWSLIHPDAPPIIGWSTSLAALMIGATALAASSVHRQRYGRLTH